MALEYDEYVSTREVGIRNSAGTGYIILPIDEDRQSYIETVYRTGLVALGGENGGVIERVLINKAIFNFLEFPEDTNSLGSLVLWVNIPKFNQPVAVAVLTKDNDVVGLSEKQFLISKDDKNGFVGVSGDAKTGTIAITASSNTDDNGEINLSVNNKSKTAKLKLNVKGSVIVNNEGETFLNSTKGITARVFNPSVDDKEIQFKLIKGEGATYSDEFDNAITINSEGFTIKNSTEDLKTITLDLITEIKNMIINTPVGAGVVSPSTITKLQQIETRVNTLFE